MSAGYAERLKEYPNKGKCGLPENYDTSRSLSSKISTLAQLMNESCYTVVLTGAGISTSAGIPDFRGPNGIWTREQQRLMKVKKKKRKRVENNKPWPFRHFAIAHQFLKKRAQNRRSPQDQSASLAERRQQLQPKQYVQ